MIPLTTIGIVLLSYAAYMWGKAHCRKPYEFFLLGWLTAGLVALSLVDHALKQCLPG